MAGPAMFDPGIAVRKRTQRSGKSSVFEGTVSSRAKFNAGKEGRRAGKDYCSTNGQPRQGIYPAGAVVCCLNDEDRRRGLQDSAKGPVSRILSCAVIPLGAALPRTLISDLPGGFGNSTSRLNASGRCAAPPGSRAPQRRRPVAGTPRISGLLPSLFGLAPCGVYPAPGLTDGAVR